MPERVVSSVDRPQHIAVSAVWELPFGRGKRWATSANPVLSRIISGWQAQGIFEIQSGAPLGFGNSIFYGNLKDVPLPNGQRTAGRWFNVDAGFERDSSKQLASNIVTLSSLFSGIRADGLNNWDLSVLKNTKISERVRVQFRSEFINAFNHVYFGSPNTTPASTAFGTITSTMHYPRVIQFGLKVLF
jgi:hypothetical protein